MDYEFLNSNTGGLLPANFGPTPDNPQQYCSGNLVNVNGQMKLLTAGHCIKEFKRKRHAPAQQPLAQNSALTAPQRGTVPLEAYRSRVMAHINGHSEGFEINTADALGPIYKFDKDPDDGFRRHDFVMADLKTYHGADVSHLPRMCDSKMTLADVAESVLIGYGRTDGGDVSPVPLCGVQPIAKIGGGIIEGSPHEKGKTGGCPGDSGGGLWILPKATSGKSNPKPCLAGVVSGPKTSTIDKSKWEKDNPNADCDQDGLVTMFNAIYTTLPDYLKTPQTKTGPGGRPESRPQTSEKGVN